MSIPRTPAAIRIAQLFKRRLTTHWSPKEEKVMRRLKKDHAFEIYVPTGDLAVAMVGEKFEGRWVENLDDLALVEKYYEFERKKGDKGIHRRDLATFLNNYGGEVDRARAWAEKHPKLSSSQSTPDKVKNQRPIPSEMLTFLRERLGSSEPVETWKVIGDIPEAFAGMYWAHQKKGNQNEQQT